MRVGEKGMFKMCQERNSKGLMIINGKKAV